MCFIRNEKIKDKGKLVSNLGLQLSSYEMLIDKINDIKMGVGGKRGVND